MAFWHFVEHYNSRGIVLTDIEEQGLARLVQQDEGAAGELLGQVRSHDWRITLYFFRLAAEDKDPISSLRSRVDHYIQVRQDYPALQTKQDSDEYRIPAAFRNK